MSVVWRGSKRRWEPTRWPGVEFEAHDPPGAPSGASLFRMRSGSVITLHDHPSGEHTLIVSGEARFGEHVVTAGDVLWTAPGETHEVVALSEVVFFGVAPRVTTTT